MAFRLHFRSYSLVLIRIHLCSFAFTYARLCSHALSFACYVANLAVLDGGPCRIS